MVWRPQDLLKEALGRIGVALCREQEIDRVASRIDGSIQVGPLAGDAKIGFIDTPGPIGSPQLSPTALAELRSVALNPPPNGHVIDLDVPFRHDLFQIPQTQRITKVASHAQNDDLGFKMPPFE
jgi:hypothetical protein